MRVSRFSTNLLAAAGLIEKAKMRGKGVGKRRTLMGFANEAKLGAPLRRIAFAVRCGVR